MNVLLLEGYQQLMTWNIPNTCVIASMGALNADSCSNSEESRIANLVIENVSSEGLNRRAFHLYASDFTMA